MIVSTPSKPPVVAATATSLRVGTFVLASPLRTPRQAAWEARSLTVLTGGRFDMGIGTGHDRVPQGAAELGMPYGTASERRGQVKQTVAHLRELDGDAYTPVMMAAGGPKALALAAEIADIVTVAASPFATRDEVAALTAGFRETAGSRAAEIELAMNLFVIGDEVPPWVRGFIGADAERMHLVDQAMPLASFHSSVEGIHHALGPHSRFRPRPLPVDFSLLVSPRHSEELLLLASCVLHASSSCLPSLHARYGASPLLRRL